MTGHQFEFYYARLLECLGWTRIQVTGEKSGGDGTNYKKTRDITEDGERYDFTLHANGDMNREIRLAFLPVDAVGVDLEQYRDTVPGAAGDLGRRHPGVQPQRYRRVPQVIRAPTERRLVLGGGECLLAGLGPDLVVAGVLQDAAPPARGRSAGAPPRECRPGCPCEGPVRRRSARPRTPPGRAGRRTHGRACATPPPRPPGSPPSPHPCRQGLRTRLMLSKAFHRERRCRSGDGILIPRLAGLEERVHPVWPTDSGASSVIRI